jgi:urease accessory protein
MIDNAGAHLKLQNWLSPAFPTGSFSYSHGLEWAVEAGWVTDRAGLQAWLEDILKFGSGRQEAILTSEAARVSGNPRELFELNCLALALSPSSERLLETVQQGNSFQRTIVESWGDFPGSCDFDDIAYPIAFGIAVSHHGIMLADAIPAYLNAFLSNLISAAIRLGVLGQRDGQSVLASLVPSIHALCLSTRDLTLDDLGSATLGVDFASLKHEQQYSRLFRS